MTPLLTAQDQGILLACAREAIASRIAHRSPLYPPIPPSLREPRGAFVTLKRHGQLRGCIGHLGSVQPLAETVKDAAVSSAFNDPRFPPLREAEWPEIQIEISVLSRLEAVPDPSQICVGVHGVVVRSGRHSGLLLPQVATEQGWDRETFLAHACRKAGLPPEAWKEGSTRIEAFTATVFHEPTE